jgi:hypothetical protein
MSDSRLIHIRDREISERWRSIAYLVALGTAATVTIVALVSAIVMVARLAE